MESLPNNYYFSAELYAEEVDNIYKDHWIFACMADEIAQDNDYYEFDLCGTPIVIQNFKGEPRAFLNVCPHRFNKIQQNTKGNRAFFCAYHAWSFDVNGSCKIPNVSAYDENVKERQLISLPLQNCGKFFFVSLNPQINHTLQEFLGILYGDLLLISDLIDKQINFTDIHHNCNWKLIIENSLECVHCKFIHADTFFNLGFGGLPAINAFTVNGSSKAEYPRSAKGKKLFQSNKHIQSMLDARVKKSDSYHHFFIYPNLLIGSVSYTNVYIGNILPVDQSTAKLRVRNYDVRLVDYDKEKSVYNYLMEEAINSNYTILKEDKAVIENIQSGLSTYKFNASLSNDEFRIKEFQDVYAKAMGIYKTQ